MPESTAQENAARNVHHTRKDAGREGLMTESFTAERQLEASGADRALLRRVLVTGAAGRIGSYFAQHSHRRYDLRLMIQADDSPDAIRDFGEVVVGDLADLDRLKELCAGMDTVVHLAANPDPAATWDSILHDNIIGTYNIFVAARAAACRRLVYASSIHAVSGYPADVQDKTTEPVNPGDLYGVSKCFGEALGRYMAEQEGLSTIAIRIGAFQPPESVRDRSGLPLLDAFVSRRDLTQLLQRAIDAENLRFAVVHGLSDNRFKRLDISDARALLGYAPQDDSARENEDLRELGLSEAATAHSESDQREQSGIRNEL
jgi:nucleoside-diphosphate-sugar epimerase